MPLSETQAKVLGVLAKVEQALTAQELSVHAGVSPDSARTAGRTLTRRGLAVSTDKVPTHWRITDSGRLLISRPVYRDYRDTERPGTRRG